MQIASIGIDLGKTTFHLVALGERNQVLVRKKFSRTQLLAYTAKIPSALIGIEACAGVYARFPASAPWSRPLLWPPSETEQPSDAGVTLPPGWVSCHDSTPLEVSRSYSASASAATAICVAC
jgi:hypothetical protein